MGKDEFMPKQSLLPRLLPSLCDGILTSMCENIMFAFVGFNREEMNTTLIPLMLVHLPAGASTRQIVHFGQEIESGMNLLLICLFDTKELFIISVIFIQK